jgi:predicted SnoaL-like aldol condensation-catalyzing enzyme
MDLRKFLDDYTNDVYLARNPEAARRYIADPCLRHEHGELVVMGIEENIARVQAFLDQFPSIDFANRCVVTDNDHVVSCFDLRMGDQYVSAVEVFKIVDGKIAETWNTKPAAGAWG